MKKGYGKRRKAYAIVALVVILAMVGTSVFFAFESFLAN